jgi:transcriptional regulator with XRE-family HTH domain
MVSIIVNDTKQDIKVLRLNGLPVEMRRSLKEARKKRGWTQRDLVSRIGLTQRHVSGIESGKIVPRYDTILELVRILDHDLLMVPRALVPVVQSLIRDHLKDQSGEGEERSLLVCWFGSNRSYRKAARAVGGNDRPITLSIRRGRSNTRDGDWLSF